MDKGTVLQKVDFLDTISFAIRKNKKFQAIMLRQLEEIIEDKETYAEVRKIVLDGMNNYLRSILKAIFGSVEDIL